MTSEQRIGIHCVAQIYLDYHATTPGDRRVADRIYHYVTEKVGNASSVDHAWGVWLAIS